MRIELSCSSCGGNRFRYPPNGNGENVVICEDCGHVVGTLEELKQKVEWAVMQRLGPIDPP